MQTNQSKTLHAVIGVAIDGEKCLYFKRSDTMENYPNTWGFLSEQYIPNELTDPRNLIEAGKIFRRMSRNRFGGGYISTDEYLYNVESRDNPMNIKVHLDIYKVTLGRSPGEQLGMMIWFNRNFYTDHQWWTYEEFLKNTSEEVHGLCTLSWGLYKQTRGR